MALALMSIFFFYLTGKAFVEFEVGVFGYEGYFLRIPQSQYYYLVNGLALLPCIHLPVDLKRPSDITIAYLYWTIVIPTAAVSLVFFEETDAAKILLPFYFVVSLAIVDWSRRTLTWPVPVFRFPELGKLLLFALVVIGGVLTFQQIGFQVNLSFADVYTRRLEARASTQTGGFLAYLQACLPLLASLTLAMGISYRKPIYVLSSIFAGVALFSFDGSKFAIFSLLTTLLFYAICHCVPRRNFFPIAMLAALLCFFGVIQGARRGNLIPYAITGHRIAVALGFLSCVHYEYSLATGPGYMAEGRIGRLTGEITWTPFGPRTIGAVYFYNPDANANVNFIAAAVSQVGPVYLLCASLLIGVVLGVIDRLEGYDPRVLGLAAMLFGTIWSNAAFETSLLNNGIFLVTLVLALARPQSQEGRCSQ